MPAALFSEARYHLGNSKFGGMRVSDTKRLKKLETENERLNRLLADALNIAHLTNYLGVSEEHPTQK